MSSPSRTRTFLKFGLIPAILVGAVVAGFLLSRPVAKVVPAFAGKAVKAVSGSVTVYDEFQMELKSEIGGRVIKSVLTPGLKVKEGQFLVQIDTGDLDLEIERIESEYNAHKQRVAVGSSVKIELATVREQLENLQRMLKLGNASEAQVIQQQRLVRQYEQRVELEDVENTLRTEGFVNTLKTKRRQREKMTVTAPFDGVIASVIARPGDLIGGGAPIASIISTARIVEAKVSEENFAGLEIGQKASVRFLPYGAELYDATIVKILPTSDPQTQRYIVHLKVNIGPDKLVPGITGEVSIVVGEREAQANIPRRALFGNNVYVVNNGRVELRQVEVGYTSLTTVEILKGLTTGETVIADEIDRFQDGDRVRVQRVENE